MDEYNMNTCENCMFEFSAGEHDACFLCNLYSEDMIDEEAKED